MARDFLERVNADDAPLRLWLGPAQAATPTDLRLADCDGVALAQSQHLHRAVRRNTGQLVVTLADGEGRVRGRGVVGTRRSVAGTIAAASRVAGPLAVHAATADSRAPGSPSTQRTPSARVSDAAGAVWFAGRLVRAAVTYREWACAPIAALDPEQGRLTRCGEWQSGPRRFWADPFLLSTAVGDWLFMEELDRTTGLGHIVAAPVRGGTLDISAVRRVLATDHHLSFPQLQWVDGRWLATVETCAAHNPVYTFDAPGEPWRSIDDLPPLPPHTADPVIDFETGWLIGTDARTDPDSVGIRYRLNDGAWHADPGSVSVDVGWRRGAGTWDRDRGWRAVQDCAGTYGRAVGLVDSRSDAPLAKWSVPEVVGAHGWRGVHSLTWSASGATWIDGWRRRPSLLGWRLRLVERHHLASCQG